MQVRSIHDTTGIFTICLTLVGGAAHAARLDLAEAAIHLERNASDGDAEAVILAKAQDCGLLFLSIRNPQGARIGRYDAPDPIGLGAREILLETPEPSEEDVVAAYPPGLYSFVGKTLCGETISGRARLRAGFPEAPVILSPTEDEVLPIGDVTIEWSPVSGAQEYVVELESSEGLGLKTTVPASARAITLPVVLFPPGDYELGVAARGSSGNVSVTETAFSVE